LVIQIDPDLLVPSDDPLAPDNLRVEGNLGPFSLLGDTGTIDVGVIQIVTKRTADKP
jgi:hypothetical protein